MRGEGTPDDERGPRCSSIVGVAGCPFDRLARRFMDRIIRLVTDPIVKGLWPDQSRSQFFEFTMDARAERQVLGENCRFGDRSRLRATARWKRIVGKCTRAAEYLIAINQGIIDRLLDVVRFRSARSSWCKSYGLTVTVHCSAPS